MERRGGGGADGRPGILPPGRNAVDALVTATPRRAHSGCGSCAAAPLDTQTH